MSQSDNMRLPGVGELAPDFKLEALDGSIVNLSEYPKPVALVFLRHLACIACSEHLVLLHQPIVLRRLEELNARILVVSFASTENIRKWQKSFCEHFLQPALKESGERCEFFPPQLFQFVSDPTLATYHAYGLDRNSAIKVFSPKVLWQYFKWGVEGKPVNYTNEDTLQRGGNFVIGPGNRILLSHTGKDQLERPAPKEIIESLTNPDRLLFGKPGKPLQ